MSCAVPEVQEGLPGQRRVRSHLPPYERGGDARLLQAERVRTSAIQIVDNFSTFCYCGEVDWPRDDLCYHGCCFWLLHSYQHVRKIKLSKAETFLWNLEVLKELNKSGQRPSSYFALKGPGLSSFSARGTAMAIASCYQLPEQESNISSGESEGQFNFDLKLLIHLFRLAF